MWKVRLTLAGLALFMTLAAPAVTRGVCPGGSNCLSAGEPTGGRPAKADVCPNGGCGSSAHS